MEADSWVEKCTIAVYIALGQLWDSKVDRPGYGSFPYTHSSDFWKFLIYSPINKNWDSSGKKANKTLGIWIILLSSEKKKIFS